MASFDDDRDNVQLNQQDTVKSTDVVGTSSPNLSPIMLALNITVHLILLGITFFIVYHSFASEITLFSWHPSLITIGYVMLMTEAILAFSDVNLTNRLGYKNIVTLHWILQSIAGVCILLGFFAIYINKNLRNKHHFVTNHGFYGLITVILTIIACAGGIVTKYGFNLRTYVRPVYLKIGHAMLGSFTFLFSTVTVVLGFYTNWFQRLASSGTQLAFSTAIAIITLYVMRRPVLLIVARLTDITRSGI